MSVGEEDGDGGDPRTCWEMGGTQTFVFLVHRGRGPQPLLVSGRGCVRWLLPLDLEGGQADGPSQPDAQAQALVAQALALAPGLQQARGNAVLGFRPVLVLVLARLHRGQRGLGGERGVPVIRVLPATPPGGPPSSLPSASVDSRRGSGRSLPQCHRSGHPVFSASPNRDFLPCVRSTPATCAQALASHSDVAIHQNHRRH